MLQVRAHPRRPGRGLEDAQPNTQHQLTSSSSPASRDVRTASDALTERRLRRDVAEEGAAASSGYSTASSESPPFVGGWEHGQNIIPADEVKVNRVLMLLLGILTSVWDLRCGCSSHPQLSCCVTLSSCSCCLLSQAPPSACYLRQCNTLPLFPPPPLTPLRKPAHYH